MLFLYGFRKHITFIPFADRKTKLEEVGVNLSNVAIDMIVRINAPPEPVGCATVGWWQATSCSKL